MDNDEILVQVAAPATIASELRKEPITGVEFEPPVGGREQTTRFGLAELALLIGICKGVVEVIKLALEIRKLLRGAERGRITTPDGRLHLEISADQSEEEIARQIRAALGSTQSATPST
ncbi:MAG TPA: hypothetical protein VE621_10280 [Bryobacteraceae bacterium]|jgi:hypothetical protein|nr:hypothetical protein [Bryobacteraceae bacterium]